jgi:hypothetical protein
LSSDAPLTELSQGRRRRASFTDRSAVGGVFAQHDVEYYLRSRTHLALNKDAPVSRAVVPPTSGDIVSIPQVGGLHHRYERRAA